MDLRNYGTREYVTTYRQLAEMASCLDINLPCFCDTEGEHFYDHSSFDIVCNRVKRIDEALATGAIDLATATIFRENSDTSLRLIQLYQPTAGKRYLIDVDFIGLDEVKKILSQLWTVWFNAPYDLGTLRMCSRKFDDLYLSIINAYPKLTRREALKRKRVSLLTASTELIPVETYGNIDKKGMQKGFKKFVPITEEQLHYSEIDVVVLSILWELPVIQLEMTKPYYISDMKTVRHCVTIQENPIYVNQEALQIEISKNDDLIEEILPATLDVNPNSYKQIRAQLQELDGKVHTASDGEYLKAIFTDNPNTSVGTFAEAIYLLVRAKKKKITLEGFNFPYVRTKYNPYGAITGRFTATGAHIVNGINAQQTARDLTYLVESDTENYTVVHADLGTAELRTACSIMQEPSMRDFLINRKDLHKVSALMAYPNQGYTMNDITKDMRQKGKAISFGFLFGMGWKRFQGYAKDTYGVEFTELESIAVKKAYEQQYPAGVAYRSEKYNTYQGVHSVSPLGRKVLSKEGAEAINMPTQGGISECIKLGMDIYLEYDEVEQIYLNDYHKYLYLQIHDALVSRLPDNLILEGTYYMIKGLLQGWQELCKSDLMKYKDIPMEVEFEYLGESVIVYNLEELKEWARNATFIKNGVLLAQITTKIDKEL